MCIALLPRTSNAANGDPDLSPLKRLRLAKADPGNAEWQRDLALSHGRVEMVLTRQGDQSKAKSAFKEGHAIIARLIQQSPDNAALPKDLAWFENQLAALKK